VGSGKKLYSLAVGSIVKLDWAVDPGVVIEGLFLAVGGRRGKGRGVADDAEVNRVISIDREEQ
jgi:hypothetical protein